MADFPPNLDDGELWIPSDILLSDSPAPAASKTASPPPHFRSNRDPLFSNTVPNQLQWFGPAPNQYALTASPPPSGTPPPAALFGFSTGSVLYSPNPVLYFYPILPAQSDGLTHQTRVHPSQTPFLFQNPLSRPRQAAGGGTGVFLPSATVVNCARRKALRNKNMTSTSQSQWVEQARDQKSGGTIDMSGRSVAPVGTPLPRDNTYRV